MIGYVTIGTNDLARAGKFYDELLGLIDAKRAMESERYIGWGAGKGSPMLMVMKPYDGKPATVGNGAMVAFFAIGPLGGLIGLVAGIWRGLRLTRAPSPPR